MVGVDPPSPACYLLGSLVMLLGVVRHWRHLMPERIHALDAPTDCARHIIGNGVNGACSDITRVCHCEVVAARLAQILPLAYMMVLRKRSPLGFKSQRAA